jgi:hypothetical protein
MNWFQKTNGNVKYYKSLEDFPENAVGFVYCITNLKNGRFYIGKKQLKATKNVKLGKKEKDAHMGVGRKPTKKTVISESDWSSYWSSSKMLKEDVSKFGKGEFLREILQICYSKKQLSYYEQKFQMVHGVIEKPDKTYNENIAGRFFPKDLK